MAKPWRRLRMGLQTVLGLKRQGFFLPYRYADSVEAPGPYPAFEALFESCRRDFEHVIELMEKSADAFAAFGGAPPAPRWAQDWFPRLDGAAAYALVAARWPRRIVEVGSGHSTRFMARAVADHHLSTEIACIDPAPRAALSGLDVNWRREVLGETHNSLFDALEAGDVAFFDSSHLLVPGADVDIILNRILPRLAPGVLVHVHDILLPDPYPPAWEWRGYAEQNALGGWILGGGLKPVFASHYAATRMGAGARIAAPLPDGALETSFWAEKT